MLRRRCLALECNQCNRLSLTCASNHSTIGNMSTETIPSQIMDDLQKAAERAAKGIRDPDAMRRACENMDRVREEVFGRHGVLDIGLPSIRELRDS